MLNIALALTMLAVLYHVAGVFGLILLGAVYTLFALRAAVTATRRRNPAPQPPTTHGRRR